MKRIQTSARSKAPHSLFRPTSLHLDKSQILNKVHELNIDGFKDREDPHFALELCFLSPARVVRVNRLYFSPRNIPKVYEGPILNPGVEDVEILKSYIRDDQLERLFQGVNGLKRLRYDHQCPEDDLCCAHRHVWRPMKLVSTLILHARHSCIHLDLTTRNEYASWLPITCGFREFEVLRDLRLNSFLLDCRPRPSWTLEVLQRFGATNHDLNDFSTILPRMVDILPASIERITLHGYIDAEQVAKLLDGLIATKEVVLPSSAKINFETFYTEGKQHSPDRSTRQHLEDVGIAVERKIISLLDPVKGWLPLEHLHY